MTSVEGALVEATAWASNRRIHLCQLEVAPPTGSALALRGTVLDAATLEVVVERLTQLAPGVELDTGQVRVLEQPAIEWLTVNVAVADVHADRGHGASVVTQLLFGDCVERLDERDGWAFVRLRDGYLGWVAVNYVARAPIAPATHRIVAPVAPLRAHPASDAKLEGRLAIGTRIRVTDIDSSWATLDFTPSRQAFVAVPDLTPLDALVPADQRPTTIARHAESLVGVPYSWGGITAFGIDCSGFVRLCHSLAGIEIPRDADWQCVASERVAPPYRISDLLFFGEAGAHRSISHVGLWLGDGRLIHSCRTHAGVAIDVFDETPWLRDALICAGSFCG